MEREDLLRYRAVWTFRFSHRFHFQLPGTFAMMKAILQTLRQDDQDPDYSTDDDTDEELR